MRSKLRLRDVRDRQHRRRDGLSSLDVLRGDDRSNLTAGQPTIGEENAEREHGDECEQRHRHPKQE